jgi:hypothetical protein
MSTRTGVAPVRRTALAVAMNVTSGTITSSPAATPAAASARKIAVVPLVVATAWAAPNSEAIRRSNSVVTSPSFR